MLGVKSPRELRLSDQNTLQHELNKDERCCLHEQIRVDMNHF